MERMFEETVQVDKCQCVYCGHKFGGRRACNDDMDCRTVECPKCEKEMNVFISVEYTCSPLEDSEV